MDSRPADLTDVFNAQREWSRDTFGPPSFRGPASAARHLKAECDEFIAAPTDVSEVADMFILVLDVAWRTGLGADRLLAAVREKQAINRARTWPPLSAQKPDAPTFHVETPACP